jgi:hypothetical protein
MDGLDRVAVGVEQERAVVVRAVLGPRPRLAVGGVAGVDTGAPEGVRELRRGRHEPGVEPGADDAALLDRHDREVAPLDDVVLLDVGPDAERREHGVVEAPGGGEVRHPDVNVVEHPCILPGRRSGKLDSRA